VRLGSAVVLEPLGSERRRRCHRQNRDHARDGRRTDRRDGADAAAGRVRIRCHAAGRRVEWTTLPDGGEALLVNGGGVDGGNGAFFAKRGEVVYAIGSLDPIVPGALGCIVIYPDGSRRRAR
jgi:hypothetical protein